MRHGFSLVELSIVLAVIGLLVGAVVAGQSLLRASDVKSVGNEYAGYQSAVSAFQGRFKALPGDMINAISYWGADSGCPTTAYDGVLKTATCNGNGDQSIATLAAPWSDYYELYRAWQHLSNAGLIKGKFVGTSGSGSFQHSVLSMNVPASKMKSAGWTFYPLNDASVSFPTNFFANDYKTVLFFGASTPIYYTFNPVLTGPEAKSIDTKYDDGRPGYGIVSAMVDAGPGFDCITVDTQASAEYILTNEQVRCSLIFKLKT